MRHLWQQTLSTISHNGNIYTIENVRDFHWTSEDSAKSWYRTIHLHTHQITGCRLYQSRFWLWRIVAHYMIGFSYTNSEWYEDEIILSIEARRPSWQQYTLRKALIPWMYSIIYIRGTPSDVLSLRKHVWHEPLVSFSLQIDQHQAQELFSYFCHRTNYVAHHHISYHAILYNCLTDLHRGIAHITHSLSPITPRTVFSKWYITYLQKMGIIKKD